MAGSARVLQKQMRRSQRPRWRGRAEQLLYQGSYGLSLMATAVDAPTPVADVGFTILSNPQDAVIEYVSTSGLT